MRKIILQICIVSFFISCNQVVERNGIQSCLQIQVDKQLPDCEDSIYFDSCRLIPLETTEQSFIKNIDKILMDEDLIFVFDRKMNRIIIFNDQGYLQTTIHRIGTGPKEYLQLTDICLDTEKKHIILYADSPNKIIVTDYKGNSLYEKIIEDLYSEIIMTGDSILLINNLDPKINNECYISYFIGKESPSCLIKKEKRPFSDVFTNGAFISSDYKLNLTRRYDNNIYMIKQNKLIPKYKIDFVDQSLPEKYTSADNNVSENELTDICRKNEFVYSIVDVQENNNFLSFRTNQAGFYIYSKKEKTLIGFKHLHNIKLDIFIGKMYPVGYNPNALIFLIEPSYLKLIADISQKNHIQKNKSFTNLTNQTKEDDNPLLLLYTFKEK